MANEKRLIDANLMWRYAWNELQKANKRHENEPGFKAWSSGVAEIIVALAKDMPTVDAVEVVHGRWSKSIGREEWYTYSYSCPECGADTMVCNLDGYYIAPNYCPNCGAKMDGGNEDG